MSPLIMPVVGLVKTFIEGRQKRKQQEIAMKDAIAAKKLEYIQQGRIAEVEWNSKAQAGAAKSWKDEWLTLLLSIPLIGAFIPQAVPYIHEGFAVLELMPDWYKAAIGVMIGSAFAYRKYADWQMAKHYTLPNEIDKV